MGVVRSPRANQSVTQPHHCKLRSFSAKIHTCKRVGQVPASPGRFQRAQLRAIPGTGYQSRRRAGALYNRNWLERFRHREGTTAELPESPASLRQNYILINWAEIPARICAGVSAISPELCFGIGGLFAGTGVISSCTHQALGDKQFGSMTGVGFSVPLYVVIDSKGMIHYATSGGPDLADLKKALHSILNDTRSEERRVGKECRS